MRRRLHDREPGISVQSAQFWPLQIGEVDHVEKERIYGGIVIGFICDWFLQLLPGTGTRRPLDFPDRTPSPNVVGHWVR